MPRFNRSRGLGLRPVNSVKHVVDTNGTISAGAASVNDISVSRANPIFSVTNEVAALSTIFSIFLSVQVVPVIAAGGVDNIYMYVQKNPANDLGNPAVDSVGTDDRRRYVIHQEMKMLGNGVDQGSNISRSLFQGVIKFPFKMRRNAIDDRWQVVIGHRAAEATQTSRFCLQCIYKEFR